MSSLTNNEFKATQIFGDFGVNIYPKNVINLGLFQIDTVNNTIYIGKNDNSSTIYLYGNIISNLTIDSWYGQLIDGLINQFYTLTDNFLNQYSNVNNSFLNQFGI
jgi:hypothetical protein